MKAVEIKKGIYWVGVIDWDLRNFHGYNTQRGSTYNAYLIIDDKITLVDTVKNFLFDEMLQRIKSVVDPEKIDYVISNHSEMDHSGSLPDIMKICKDATVVASPIGEKNLKKHFDTDNWKFHTVKTGETLKIGKRTLDFVLTQMVHWPDSMATYVMEDKLLLPNDAFGQHIASFDRFENEIGYDIVLEEARKYYANIILPLGGPVNTAFKELSKLDIDMIAPSHGLIWKDHVKDILEYYKKWANNAVENKAVIIYDTMWGSTKKMAYSIFKAFEEKNIHVELKNLKTCHISDIMTSVIDSKYICIGSPTLNNKVLPTVAGFLCYLQGLNPQNRIGLAFGSYGWNGKSIEEIEKVFRDLKYQMLDSISHQYVPKANELEQLTKDFAVKL